MNYTHVSLSLLMACLGWIGMLLRTRARLRAELASLRDALEKSQAPRSAGETPPSGEALRRQHQHELFALLIRQLAEKNEHVRRQAYADGDAKRLRPHTLRRTAADPDGDRAGADVDRFNPV